MPLQDLGMEKELDVEAPQKRPRRVGSSSMEFVVQIDRKFLSEEVMKDAPPTTCLPRMGLKRKGAENDGGAIRSICMPLD